MPKFLRCTTRGGAEIAVRVDHVYRLETVGANPPAVPLRRLFIEEPVSGGGMTTSAIDVVEPFDDLLDELEG